MVILRFVALLIIPGVAAADAVAEWSEIAVATAVAGKHAASEGSRTSALVHTAIFDAVNAIEARYTPYKIPATAPANVAPEAAPVPAAHAVLVRLYPGQKNALDQASAKSLGRIANGRAKTDGIAVGERAGPRWWRCGRTMARPPPTRIGRSRPRAHTCSEWARDCKEVRELGGAKSAVRTAEQTDIARFWTIVGPSSWDPVLRAVAAAPGRTLLQNARLFALAEMAAVDAHIAVFDAKYTYNFWRPITAIQERGHARQRRDRSGPRLGAAGSHPAPPPNTPAPSSLPLPRLQMRV